jgi:hypothetical protein
MSQPPPPTREERWRLEMQRLCQALQTLDAPTLHALTPLMRAHPNVRVRDEDMQHNRVRPWNRQGVRLTAPPLCVLLERLKLRRDDYSFESEQHQLEGNAALTVLATEWGVDLNRPFEVTEVRPRDWVDWRHLEPGHRLYNRAIDQAANRQNIRHRIVSTPLSWMLYLRPHAEGTNDNRCVCMRRLLELGADPNQPFHFFITEGEGGGPGAIMMMQPHDAAMNGLNGQSLLQAALAKGFFALPFLSLLLEFGARFGPNDPRAPLCTALENLRVMEIVQLFHRYWRLGQITTQDVLAQEMDAEGYTALHHVVEFPPHDLQEAETVLQMLLEMGFTARTTTRTGITALALAEEKVQAPGPYAVANPERYTVALRLLRAEHAAYCRTMAMEVQHSLRGVHEGRLPSEAIQHIGRFLPELAPHGMAHATRAEAMIRVRMLRARAQQQQQQEEEEEDAAP